MSRRSVAVSGDPSQATKENAEFLSQLGVERKERVAGMKTAQRVALTPDVLFETP